jgi:glycosyltransferase involved in cell wall biosynthesis
MTISVIIATYSRYVELKNMLASIINQNYKEFEVIIVDQNNDTRINKIIQEIGISLKKLKVIKQQRNNLSEARNRGIERAIGDIYFFPDDDSIIPHNFFLKIVDQFKKNVGIDFISVPVFENDYDISKSAGNKYQTITVKNARNLTTATSIIYKKQIIMNIKRFDTHFGLGGIFESSEDLDFVLRTLYRGYKGYFYTGTFVIHENPVKVYDENAARRAYRYNRGFGALVKKHLRMFGNKHLVVVFVFESLRNIGNMVMHLMLNPLRAKYNYLSLKGKIEGFLTYSL